MLFFYINNEIRNNEVIVWFEHGNKILNFFCSSFKINLRKNDEIMNYIYN